MVFSTLPINSYTFYVYQELEITFTILELALEHGTCIQSFPIQTFIILRHFMTKISKRRLTIGALLLLYMWLYLSYVYTTVLYVKETSNLTDKCCVHI